MYKVFVTMAVVIALFTFSCRSVKTSDITSLLSDSSATSKTIELYRTLYQRVQEGIMVGHQDDLAYGHGWYGELGRSDVKDVTGDYPAVIGWELGDIELGAPHNLDSVFFKDIRTHVIQTAQRGGVTTMSWHTNNPATGGNSWDCDQDTVVRSVLPGGVHHALYLGWLDRLGDFFLSLKDDTGEFIPVVFRPYHEHTGGWFWWGAKQCTPEEYKALWRMTQEYLQKEKQVNHLIYAYSTAEVRDEAHFLERYPGDNAVDMVAFDCYVPGGGTTQDLQTYRETMERNIAIITAYAEKSGKIATIGETGFEGVKDPSFFTSVIYPLVKDKPLSWVLFWRNAYELGKENHYYLPFKGHAAAADFKQFTAKEDVWLNKGVK